MENIQKLLSNIRHLVELDNEQKEDARNRGEHFNVFSVLRMETAEMETHSAFLASLLNPDGDHGMKDAFLESFIAKTGCADLNLVADRCAVQVEHFTGDGRIDILIADNLEHKAIVIENKIYASDQDAQLKRYHNYATANYKEGFRYFPILIFVAFPIGTIFCRGSNNARERHTTNRSLERPSTNTFH